MEWPRVIRDPIHNLVVFENTAEDRLLWELLDTAEFQRLRRIKQLGLSELTFPGATHTRFAHSIGVMQMTRRFVEHLERRQHLNLSKEQRALILCAALLHDIGHGPFSHAFETVTKDNHESRTLEIIQDSTTEVNRVLSNYDSNFPDALSVFFEKEPQETKNSTPHQETLAIPDVAISIVSSQLDGDRFDYLLRDSYFTGTSYGFFDVDWLLQHIEIDLQHQRIVLSSKGLHAAEAYIFARYHMYRSVYFHKATRAGEVMLKLIFERLSELIKENSSASIRRKIPSIPNTVVSAFSSEKLSLEDYLALDDTRLLEFFHAARNSKDSILNSLGHGLLARHLFKAVDTTNFDAPKIGEFVSRVKELFTQEKRNLDYFFRFDTPADTPYKPYDPDEEKPAQQIFVVNHHGKAEEIGKQLDTLAPLRKKYSLTRYYFPAEYRDKITKIADEELKS